MRIVFLWDEEEDHARRTTGIGKLGLRTCRRAPRLLLFALPIGAVAPRGSASMIVYLDYLANAGTVFGCTTLVGRAGVLRASPTEATRCSEYGLSDPGLKGRVLQRTIPVVKMTKGTPAEAARAGALAAFLSGCEWDGRICAASFVHIDFDAMLRCAAALRDASDWTSPAYDQDRAVCEIKSTCGHFAECVEFQGAAKTDQPAIVPDRPNNLVGEYTEELNAEVTWDPQSREDLSEHG